MNVYVRKPRLESSSPHRFSGGELYLHDDDDVDPEVTAKVYLDWAIKMMPEKGGYLLRTIAGASYGNLEILLCNILCYILGRADFRNTCNNKELR